MIKDVEGAAKKLSRIRPGRHKTNSVSTSEPTETAHGGSSKGAG